MSDNHKGTGDMENIEDLMENVHCVRCKYRLDHCICDEIAECPDCGTKEFIVEVQYTKNDSEYAYGRTQVLGCGHRVYEFNPDPWEGAPEIKEQEKSMSDDTEMVQKIKPEESISFMQRSANKTLMVAFINADLFERAALDVRSSTVFYDESKTFLYATNETVSEETLRKLFKSTLIRFWSIGV